jgi:uncharacterized protein (TIGR03435 family)
MMRSLAGISFVALLTQAVFGQASGVQNAAPAPTFEIADVHVSAHVSNPNLRGGVLRAGRYEIRTATMVDLIRTAYGIDADKVLGGPSWLESDRFDVIAKAPPGATPETAKLMLQALLADRFKLVLHTDSHPLPAYALTVGKGGPPKLKEADGSGDIGCKPTVQTPPPPAPGGQNVPTIMLPTFLYACHSMTMAAFADALRTMNGAQQFFDTSPVVDQTGLKGAWDFTFKYTPKIPPGLNVLLGPGFEIITIFDAVDKQLGLKLDSIKMPIPVMIVDSVNRKPTDNPSGVTTTLPVIPTEFEVADIRLSDPNAGPMPNAGFQPSGRVDLRNYPLKNLITLAWDLNPQADLAGAPKWLDSARVDLIAKMDSGPAAPNQGIDIEAFRPALKALLIERFKMAIHTEPRPVSTYALVAAKPKLAKADPLGRTNCKEGPAPGGKDPRDANPILSRLVTCLNMTMAEFADRLQGLAPGYLQNQVVDSTGIEGAYDFTLSFSANGLAQAVAARVAADAGQPAGASAPSDPGGGVTLFDALTKQLGLKLEQQKITMPVIVIDHIEEKPIDN